MASIVIGEQTETTKTALARAGALGGFKRQSRFAKANPALEPLHETGHSPEGERKRLIKAMVDQAESRRPHRLGV